MPFFECILCFYYVMLETVSLKGEAMKRYLILSMVAAILAGVIVGCGKKKGNGASKAGKVFISIGTGSMTGVYYPVGSAIMKLVNKNKDGVEIKAKVESTGGSVYNINAVVNSDLTFGVAQADRQFQAVKGLQEWKDKPQSKLRAICSLHPEIITLVATDASGIKNLTDFKGKKINIGNAGSGNRGNAEQVLKVAGIPLDSFTAESLNAGECPKMIQDGRIDAFFYTVGHPAGTIKEATAGKRKVHFVPITGMEKLLAECPYYAVAAIPVKNYPMSSSKEDVPSIGMMTTFVTSSDVPEDVVYKVTKAIFSNLDELRKMHPALENLTPEGMLKGLSAPLHPGAEKYLKEAGLLK